jgi:preprotein translocase subunit SecA
LPLAQRIFAEREEDADTALDRWTAGLLWSLNMPAALQRRSTERFLRAVLAQESQMTTCDDARLRVLARETAAPTFVHRDPVAAVRSLAVVREAARRTVGLHPHPAQILTTWKLLRGRLVELDTGQGKTLSAALTACLAGLAGIPTHVVTVNDYLAQRDAQVMGPLFAFFGLSVGVIHSGVAQAARAKEYARSVTYCTNKDLAFDYLRDRVNGRGVRSLAQLAVRKMHGVAQDGEPLRLRGLHFAILDEADSILIDEGRTPLILSSARDKGRDEAAYRALLEMAGRLEVNVHFRFAGALHIPELTPAGREHLQDLVTQDTSEVPLDTFWQVSWVREHYISQALRALHVFKRDLQYVVQEGKVVIVDEFTGRLLPDRSWEQGLHQLVEVKEGCAVTGVNRTLARLTYQTFFARYLRLSGMSGTLREVGHETAAVFRVRTERVEPFRPSRRQVLPTLLLPTETAKYAAVVAEISQCLDRGQPVLVGTRSVRASRAVSEVLTTAGIAHRVLNALQDADEAELIAGAGTSGAVTVATNMAGRGTDISLAAAVIDHGGLHVVLTEWHESARIDRQLFGRCARQGDPGSCRAIVSLEDEIIQRHSPGVANWVRRRWPKGDVPQWAIRFLRVRVQALAERINAAQRRQTTAHDRHMQAQLAFSGTAE